MSSIPKSISSYYQGAVPSGKRVRYDLATAQRVAEYFLDNLEKIEEIEPSDKYILAKKIFTEKEETQEIRSFRKQIFGALDKEDVWIALNEGNIAFVFSILDNAFLTPQESKEIENAICQMDWSAQLKDPEFYKMMGKIQIALNFESRKICETLIYTNNDISLHILSSLWNKGFPEIDIYFVGYVQVQSKIPPNLTEDAMEEIYQSSYLRNLLFQDKDFQLLIISNKLEARWMTLINNLGKVGTRRDRYDLFVEALKHHEMDMIRTVVQFLPDTKQLYAPDELLQLDISEEGLEGFLSRFEIYDTDQVLLYGSEASISYLLKKGYISYPLSDNLMKAYLENPLFSVKIFHQLFNIDEARILNLDNDEDYDFTKIIMDLRPELVVEVLSNHRDAIPAPDLQEFFEMHLEGVSATARFNLNLVELIYGKENPNPKIEKNILGYPNYKKGDLQRIFYRYPLLKESFIQEFQSYPERIDPDLRRDIIEIYKEGVLSDNSNIFHILAKKTYFALFIDLLSEQDIPKLMAVDTQGNRPFDYIKIPRALGTLRSNKLMSLSNGKYSTLFNKNGNLLFLYLRLEKVFKMFVKNEPHLMDHFKEPLAYADSTEESMRQDFSLGDLYTLLSAFGADEIDQLEEKGFTFDPFARECRGNTFFHLHPFYFKGFIHAKELVNARGETPLWNPSQATVRGYIREGADPTHLAQDGSNFLHGYQIQVSADCEIFPLLKGMGVAIWKQKNGKGEIALINVLRSINNDPRLFHQCFKVCLACIDYKDPQIEVYLLNQILSFEEGYRIDNRAVPLPEPTRVIKENLFQQVSDHFELSRPFLKEAPLVFRLCLIQFPTRFTREELMTLLQADPPLVLIEYLFSNEQLSPDLFNTFEFHQKLKVLPLLSADTIYHVMDRTSNDLLSEDTWDEMRSRIDHILTYIKEIEGDWINWFNTTQEELKCFTIEQTALYTRTRLEETFKLLPYFYNLQQAIIIPLLPIEKLREFVLSQPLEKRSEYIRYATTAQKRALFQDIQPFLLPESYRTWNKKDWEDKTQNDLAPIYLIKKSSINRLRHAFLKNLENPLKATLAAHFDAAQTRFDEIKQEVEALFSQLPSGDDIPPEWIDPISRDLLEDPIFIPGNPPFWLSKATWIEYQKSPLHYQMRDEFGSITHLPSGKIMHPTQARPIDIASCREDPARARALEDWKRTHT